MVAIVLILTWSCATGIVTSASRMTWAFARDAGLPFSSIVKRVERRTRVPVIAVLVCVGLACLLAIIYVGSSTAFNDVVSLTISGFYLSYFVPASYLLYNRLRGRILPHQAKLHDEDVVKSSATAVVNPNNHSSGGGGGGGDINETGVSEKTKDPEVGEARKPGSASSSDHGKPKVEDSELDGAEGELIAYAPGRLFWGPWHVPGIWGIINNIYACLYMIFVFFWCMWPPAVPVSAESMNYSVLVTGAVVLFSIFWYLVRGRKEYRGPLVEKQAIAMSGLLNAADEVV